MQAGAISWDFEWFNIIKTCQRFLPIIQCVPFVILSLSGDETGWGEACAWRTKGKMKHRDLRLKAQHPCKDAKDAFEAWKMRANQQPLAEHQIKAALFPMSALNVKGTAWAVLAGLPHGSPCRLKPSSSTANKLPEWLPVLPHLPPEDITETAGKHWVSQKRELRVSFTSTSHLAFIKRWSLISLDLPLSYLS